MQWPWFTRGGGGYVTAVGETTPQVPVRASVPVRTILATIGLILATVVAVLFVMRVEQVLVWMLIALFSIVYRMGAFVRDPTTLVAMPRIVQVWGTA
jgi:hypothetical protein